MITGQREERETEVEKESLSPPPTVPLTCHHLYCQGPSARLAPAWAPINHGSAGRREAGGRRPSQPSSADERVFIDQEGEREEGEAGCVSKWLMKECKYRYECSKIRLCSGVTHGTIAVLRSCKGS